MQLLFAFQCLVSHDEVHLFEKIDLLLIYGICSL